MIPVLDTSITILGFSAFAALGLSLVSYYGEMRPARKNANRRMALIEAGGTAQTVSAKLLTKAKPTGVVAQFLSQEFYLTADNWCRQANPEFSLRNTALCVLAIFAALSFLVVLASSKLGPAAVILGMVGAAILTGSLSWIALVIMRQKRIRALSEQLPTAIDLMIRSLRAGHPVVAAIHLAAEEMADPIGTELGIVVDETTYGVELKEALLSLYKRTRLEDFAFLQVSVSIQSETGGNLAEILSNLASVIRSRFMLEKKVKALASEGKMSAIILSVLPILMVSGIMAGQPSYYNKAVVEPEFWPVAVGVLILYIFGLYLIHRITNFKY
jgi:tight adherence protein B